MFFKPCASTRRTAGWPATGGLGCFLRPTPATKLGTTRTATRSQRPLPHDRTSRLVAMSVLACAAVRPARRLPMRGAAPAMKWRVLIDLSPNAFDRCWCHDGERRARGQAASRRMGAAGVRRRAAPTPARVHAQAGHTGCGERPAKTLSPRGARAQRSVQAGGATCLLGGRGKRLGARRPCPGRISSGWPRFPRARQLFTA